MGVQPRWNQTNMNTSHHQQLLGTRLLAESQGGKRALVSIQSSGTVADRSRAHGRQLQPQSWGDLSLQGDVCGGTVPLAACTALCMALVGLMQSPPLVVPIKKLKCMYLKHAVMRLLGVR